VKSRSNLLGLSLAAAGGALGMYAISSGPGVATAPVSASVQPDGSSPDTSAEPKVFYPNCAAARAAGAAPMNYGDPGYREDLDGDDDGIACEPYHHR